MCVRNRKCVHVSVHVFPVETDMYVPSAHDYESSHVCSIVISYVNGSIKVTDDRKK